MGTRTLGSRRGRTVAFALVLACSIAPGLEAVPALADGGTGGNTAAGPGGAGGAGFTGNSGSAPDPSSTNAGGGGGGAGGGAGGNGEGALPGAGGVVGVNGGAGGAATDGGGGGGAGGLNGNGSGAATIANGSPLTGGAGGTGGAGVSFSPSGGGGGGAGGYGAVVTGSGASSNSSTITGGNGGAGGIGYGSGTAHGGSGGDGGAGGIGVQFTTSGAVFTNSGTITGGNGGFGGAAGDADADFGVAGNGGAGIAGSGVTIINRGTIAGGSANGGGGVQANAITFTGGTNVLEIQSGSIISGNVVAFSAADTLRLGGDTSDTFSVSQIGPAAQYQNFGVYEKTGNSIWTLTGTTSTLTPWTIKAGTLAISADSNLGAAAGNVTLDGGALENTATLSSARGVTLNAGGGTFSTDAGTTLTLSGVIGGSGGLTKTGAGTLTLSGANTYTGGTTVNAGTLAVGRTNALASTGALTVGASGTFDINGFNQTIGSLAGSGTVTNGDSTSATLTVGDSSSTTFSGVIKDGTHTTALTKVGSGTLTLSGANTYTGATAVDAGTLVLSGSVAGNATVASGATIMGTGTVGGNLTVSGIIAPGNSIGTLNVTGNYTQNAGSTYNVEVNAAGQSDKIAVTGSATLNGGTVAVQAANGSYQRNTSYTIVTASGGVNGTYSSVTSNLAFLKPSLSYSGNAVLLTLLASASSFQNGAQTPNQRAVGQVLDTASPTATGDFATVLNAIYGLDTTQGPRVLDALSGQNYSGFSSLMVQGAQLFMDAFQTQAGGGGGSSYQALRTESCPDPKANVCDGEPQWGVWGGGLGAFGTVAGDANSHGLTYNLGGFVAGLDRRFDPGFRAGIAAGFNAASLYTQGMPGYGNSNTVQVALYGEYLADALYLDALAGYAHSDNRMNRPIVIPGLPFRTAYGNTTANTFFGQLEAGYKLVIAPSFGGFVTPFARLQASTSTQNGFSETGADSLDLTVAQQTTNSLRTVLGAQLGADLDAPWREKLKLVLRLGWSHEFADTTRPVTASFAGAPALGFTTFGASAPRDGVVLGLGANTAIAERTSLYFRYDGDLAGANTNHILSAGVRYVW